MIFKINVMPLTIPQLKNLSFGYLSGNDLLSFAAPQLLIKQWEVLDNSLKDGCDLAISEIVANLSTRYTLDDELAKKGYTEPMFQVLLSGGGVSAVNVVYGGSGFTIAPALTFSGSGGAAATATVENGIITAINVTAAGSGYTTAPNLTAAVPVDTRLKFLVKVAAILAIRNILGNFQNLSETMLAHFSWVDKTLKNFRDGQLNVLAKQAPTSTVGSPGIIVQQDFSTLG